MKNIHRLEQTQDEMLTSDISDEALEVMADADGPARTGTTITYFMWMCDPGE
jgi:hypothetical protein